MQLEQATYYARPSSRFPGEQGWHVNVGDKEGTVEAQFELSAILAAGRGRPRFNPREAPSPRTATADQAVPICLTNIIPRRPRRPRIGVHPTLGIRRAAAS